MTNPCFSDFFTNFEYSLKLFETVFPKRKQIIVSA